MNESLKDEYMSLKKERRDIISKDPGDYKGADICSFPQSKLRNPELHKWYIEKSKINKKIYEIDDKISDLEERLVESMESKICKEGNILVPRNPKTKYAKRLSFLVIGKFGRDRYELFNNISKKFAIVHWKCLVKNYKQSEISE